MNLPLKNHSSYCFLAFPVPPICFGTASSVIRICSKPLSIPRSLHTRLENSSNLLLVFLSVEAVKHTKVSLFTLFPKVSLRVSSVSLMTFCKAKECSVGDILSSFLKFQTNFQSANIDAVAKSFVPCYMDNSR